MTRPQSAVWEGADGTNIYAKRRKTAGRPLDRAYSMAGTIARFTKKPASAVTAADFLGEK